MGPEASRTVEIMETMIEERRVKALGGLCAAADCLRHGIERLRWAPHSNPEDLAQTVAAFRENAVAGLASYDEMAGIRQDLAVVRSSEAARPAFPDPVALGFAKLASAPAVVEPVVQAGKLDTLATALADTAETETRDLGALVQMLRNGHGDGPQIVALMESLNTHHERLKSLFAEAVEVSSCSGSA